MEIVEKERRFFQSAHQRARSSTLISCIWVFYLLDWGKRMIQVVLPWEVA